jgi:hypothetical protein
MKKLERLLKGTITSAVSTNHFTASCRGVTKQGNLDVQFTMRLEEDGTLTLTGEAVYSDKNPLSRRTCIPVANQRAVVAWLDEQLADCAVIHAGLDR